MHAMNIKSLYEQACLYPVTFWDNLGINKTEFEVLLKYFSLSVPTKLSKEERLFAILYVEKFNLDGKEIGQIIPYVNAKRDGDKFIPTAKLALSSAKQQLIDLHCILKTIFFLRSLLIKSKKIAF